MRLEVIALAAFGIWVAVALVAVSACRAAKRSDNAMRMDLARASAVSGDDEITPSPSPSPRRPLRTLDLDDAASLLGISPETLLAWEMRYGFPTASPLEQRYSPSEVLALRDSIEDGLSIASAVARAREKAKRRRPTAGARLGDHRDDGVAS